MAAMTSSLTTLALLLLGAHFLRAGNAGMAAALLLAAGMAWGRRAWMRVVLALVLAGGAVVWAKTAVQLINLRLAMGVPWERLALILGGVLCVTLAALAAQLWSEPHQRRGWPSGPIQPSLPKQQGQPGMQRTAARQGGTARLRAGAFVVTAVLLGIAKVQAPFPILMVDRLLPAGQGWGWLFIGGMAWYAGWLAEALWTPEAHRRLRPRIWAAFSFVFFGQLALGLAGWEDFLMTGTLHWPVPALIVAGPIYRGEGIFMLLLFASTVAMLGPAWCSHLCYIGAWDDAASRTFRLSSARMHAQKIEPGRWLWWGRGGTLLFVVLAALGLRAAGASPWVASCAAGLFGLVGVGVMLKYSPRWGRMAHCSAYCPVGLVGNLLGRLSPWRVRISPDCSQCGRCAKACRYGALENKRLRRGRPGLSCTACGDCMSACAQGHIHYTFAKMPPASSRALFLVLAASLHAVFLAVARL